MIKTTYPEYINEVAEHLGRLRNESNSKLKENNPRYKRGDLDLYVDVLGIKGELIVSNYLHNKNINHKLNTLLDDKPVCDWDIKIENKTYDVKSLGYKRQNLLVNEEAHRKKKMDYYAFVMPFDKNKAYIWKYSYKQVCDWEVKFFGYTNAYCKKVSYE